MPPLVFIGDELTATGFRLAGADVRVPDRSEIPAVFKSGCKEASILLITAAFARELPSGVLDTAQRAERPLVLVVPDIKGAESPPNIRQSIHAVLGIES